MVEFMEKEFLRAKGVEQITEESSVDDAPEDIPHFNDCNRLVAVVSKESQTGPYKLKEQYFVIDDNNYRELLNVFRVWWKRIRFYSVPEQVYERYCDNKTEYNGKRDLRELFIQE